MTVTILIGDVRARLAEMADESVDCVVTSPPYWGLRDYGVDGQIGLEPTIGEHLAVMVEVFREIRRVLKRTGTVWLNYGDCYATSPNGRSAADTRATGRDDRTFRDKPFSTVQGVLKAKDLCMVPNRLAIALQEDGWFVRAEIIWAKPNPMPESVSDRPATAHEKIFLLSRSARYYYDPDSVRQGRKSDEDANEFRGGSYVAGTAGPRMVKGNKRREKQRGHVRRHDGFADRWDGMSREEQTAHGRNLRNYEPAPVQVWDIATRPFSDAHFATFPPELAERCVMAGCPQGGVVFDPFGGAGTSALVAAKRGLSCTIIELNPEYAEMARQRIVRAQGMFGAGVRVVHRGERVSDA